MEFSPLDDAEGLVRRAQEAWEKMSALKATTESKPFIFTFTKTCAEGMKGPGVAPEKTLQGMQHDPRMSSSPLSRV